MKNGKIYWVKQKAIGILLLILSIILIDMLMKDKTAIIFLIISVPTCLWLLFTKERIFSRDYTFDIRKFLE